MTLFARPDDPIVTQLGFTNGQTATINTTPAELVDDFNQALAAALDAAGLPRVVADQTATVLETVVTTGDLAANSTTIVNVADTSRLAVGQLVSGTGIPAGTTVLGVSGHTVTLSANSTAAATGVSLTFTQTQSRLVLSPQVPGSVQVLTLHTTAGDPTTAQLGFADGQAASFVSPSLEVAGTANVPANGRLASDTHFSLTIDGRAPVPVTVPLSSTSGNTTPQQLATAFNAALQAAGITSVVANLATSIAPGGAVQTILVFYPSVVGSIGSLILNTRPQETRW